MSDSDVTFPRKGGVCQPIQEMASLFLETLRQAELGKGKREQKLIV